jgi:putative ABC transport system permease protein
MQENFLKIFFRRMARERSYVIINVAGLAIGLFCSMLIGLFVLHELSYDRFHQQRDNIFRVYLEGKLGETELKGAWTCAPLGPALLDEYPEVVNQVRINTWGETVIQYEDKGFIEQFFGEADSGFFQIFSVPLLRGDPSKVLSSVYNLVITESTAKKIFGDQDPIGKSLRVGTDTNYYTVTGLMADIPGNSHLQLNAIGSFMTSQRSADLSWTSNSFYTYLLLAPGARRDELESKIAETVKMRVGPELEQFLGITIDEFLEAGNRYGYKLQRLTDIHLDPTVDHDLKPPHDKKYIYIFSLVAFIILVMAGINYTNLATARSSGRSKEIGIRKILGSEKRSLILQFLTESVVMVLVAMVIALVLLELLLPYLNNHLGLSLVLDYTGQWYTIPALVLLVIVLALISGIYPAFYLASFRPLQVMSGMITGFKSRFGRNSLVIVQMTASVLLIFSSILIYRQINFMLSRDLGYDKENMLVIRRAGALGGSLDVFLQETESLPGVIRATHSTSVPNHPNNHNGYRMEGEAGDRSFLLQTNWVDYEYIDTWDIRLSSGRFFSREYGADSSVCIINMAAVKQFGLDDPIGKVFLRPVDQNRLQRLTVVGVAEDFHYQSLHQRIYPYIFILKHPDTRWGYISLRLRPENIRQTMVEIENTWNKLTRNTPMVYFFMEQDYDNLYREDRRTGQLSVIFSFLSIIIASLGLLGLASFTTRARTKEIGIRKVNGASTWNIILLLFKDIFLLVSISTLLAWTAGYYFATGWLRSFYFQTSLSGWEFAGSLACVLLISVMAAGWQVFRAASVNPAETLKYE